jgi:hypothetical protein
MNELQMVLHNSLVNREREAEGKPPINGIWLWGAGSLPEAASEVPWHKVWSGDAFVKGLARLRCVPAYGLPGSYAAWRKRAGGAAQSVTGGANELFVFDVLNDPRIEPSLYAEWLERLEGMWFAPLLAALQKGEIGSIRLSGMDGREWCITPKSARRWWRRRRPLAAYGTPPSVA